jgi:hypothetical protein
MIPVGQAPPDEVACLIGLATSDPTGSRLRQAEPDLRFMPLRPSVAVDRRRAMAAAR